MSILSQFREELDDHRDAINENADEVQSNHQLLLQLDQKLNWLAERIDELSLFVKGTHEKPRFEITPLNQKEKEVFVVLYQLTETSPFCTYREMARKLAIPDSLAASYITRMIEKGIPIVKKYDCNTVFLRLEDCFRQTQAKENIVGINPPLTCWLQKDSQ